jgi:methyl-accepting chemotaxis protein
LDDSKRLRLGIPGPVSLGLQVVAGIGSLLVLLTVCVLVAVVLIVNARDEQASLHERNLPYARAIVAVAINAKAIANAERGYLMSGKGMYADSLRQRTRRVRAAFAAAEGAAADERQARTVAEARRRFERWIATVEAGIAGARAGHRTAASTASLGRGRTLRLRYEASAAAAGRLAESAIHARAHSLAASATRSVTILLLCLSVALAVGVGITFWLTRAILRPVEGLLALLAKATKSSTTQ